MTHGQRIIADLRAVLKGKAVRQSVVRRVRVKGKLTTIRSAFTAPGKGMK